jgi:hypothetical protein
MSSIGTGGAGFVPLVGSTAGLAGQQRLAGANQQTAEAAGKTQQAAREAELQQSVGDVGESNQTGDRDADGREAWRWTRSGPPPHEPGAHTMPHSVDPEGDRGNALDLEA